MLEKDDEEILMNSNNNNDNKEQKRISLLNSQVIKSEEKKRKPAALYLSLKNEKLIKPKNIGILFIIILIICSVFFFKQKLIELKHNYLSDKSLFPLNIFYSEPKNNFLMFIILICCFTISSGFKLLILQFLTYLLSIIIIMAKNKLSEKENIFEINLVIFHCNDIIISFLFLREKLDIKDINIK